MSFLSILFSDTSAKYPNKYCFSPQTINFPSCYLHHVCLCHHLGLSYYKKHLTQEERKEPVETNQSEPAVSHLSHSSLNDEFQTGFCSLSTFPPLKQCLWTPFLLPYVPLSHIINTHHPSNPLSTPPQLLYQHTQT